MSVVGPGTVGTGTVGPGAVGPGTVGSGAGVSLMPEQKARGEGGREKVKVVRQKEYTNMQRLGLFIRTF